ncbi:MAG: diguanylate cyclase [Burkholderiales bacterium]
MSAVTASTLQQLQELREKFRKQLPARITAVDDAARGFAHGEWDPAAARELRRLLHSLAGSAGTFGFSAVGEAARKAEARLESLLEIPATPATGQLGEMTQLLHELRQTAATEQPQPFAVHQASRPEAATRRLVYLVDDDEDFALDLSLQLANFGYEVQIFPTPGALQTALGEARPAAILVDIVFKGDMLGTTAVQELRRTVADLPPLVFISVRDDFAARLGAVRAGCSDYFTKPVDTGALVDCLDKLTRSQPEEPCRILIVDDSPIDAACHATNLQQAGFDTAIVTDPADVLAVVANFTPDLILMDLHMSQCNGIELAAVIRQKEAYLGTPIVFLSGETSRSRQMSALKQGADDFLVKPIKPDHLAAVVRARAERGRLLRSLMVRDSLTGLYNHRAVKEQLAAETARAERFRTALAVAMIDIDHFKKVNDTYGHSAGDRAIQNLARLLQQRLRTTDIIGRYGGEEFIVILPGARAGQAQETMEKIRASYGAVRHCWSDKEFTLSFSCGIASFPEFGNPALLLDAADRALYEAKRTGRNRIAVAG